MLDWFIKWTTQLNQNDHFAFALVTVVTMASIGVAIAVTAEFILKRLSAGKSGSPGHHHPSGH
jgi:hypothetical protein